jgi:hypothetical protein
MFKKVPKRKKSRTNNREKALRFQPFMGKKAKNSELE